MSCATSLKPTTITHGIIWMLALSLAGASAAQTPAAKPAGLRIVVIAGEDAVNVIQQKTAVAPVVQVLDQNGQPVAGATVKFAIEGGRATFTGAKTLTVTTDTAGRAAVSGLTPTTSGAVLINAAAVFQGQTAAVAIAQTNVMTAAQAVTAAAGGGAAGGGGGLSFTTIALIGGAVAGGAVVATQTLGGGSGTSYTGSFSGPLILAFPSSTTTCTRTETYNGTVEMDLDVNGDAVTGTALVDGKVTITAESCGGGQVGATGNIQSAKTQVAGGTANLSFKHDEIWTNPPTANDPGGSTNTVTVAFSGALNAGAITGTLTITNRTVPTNPNALPGGANGGNAFGGSGSASYSVTLR